MQSKATTVTDYLKSLPADRRTAIEAVRKTIRANLDSKFEEGMQYGMIGYYVPHREFPAGYHCDPKQPLPYVCVASQKNHMSIHMLPAYVGSEFGEWLRVAWVKSGKKLDMGKGCIRIKRVEDVPLDVLGAAIRRMPAKKWIEIYQSALDTRGSAKASAQRAPAAKKKKSSTTSAKKTSARRS